MNARLPAWVRLLAWCGFALLYLPMLAIAILSVNQARHGMTWRGFTWDWYAALARNEAILEAARNSMVLALSSGLIATALGTGFAYGVWRRDWPRRTRAMLDFILHLPVVTPDILFAAALVLVFGLLRIVAPVFNPGMPAMIIAHVTFQIAFVALVVQSRLATIPRELLEAASDLYADDRDIMRRVILPLAAPGILAGALLAVTLSLDDFIISFFTAGPGSTTLPILIYASVRRGVTPDIHALSMVLFGLNVALVLLLQQVEPAGRKTTGLLAR